jgi:transketolase
MEEYRVKYPDLADELERMQKREPPKGWDAGLPSFPTDSEGLATRDIGQGVERHRAALSLADRRRSGLGAIDQDASDI